ncbi:bifunctional metallophosphatase/5'-nucleotidase [Levilactobacillus bambusae]|uniref:Bifunctional metallophosphatase/5'-nucleotidase n=1 Tax=Levilactobacillus bambusae TaxID=2024736 RepID=A0A2V1N2W8_9LACO|nr:bifunctional metallophosphatase/5'-nucleotidase [Levilactobacillus bambusae]PWG00440.1 bifunctional metallophosphatase/5'-nucleotidase [Levilactobacillus bambusae]
MKIKILSTSDVHGYLYPTNYSTPDNVTDYGMLKAATIINRLKTTAADDEVVIAIENGDWLQGSPLTSYVAKKMPPADQRIMTEITARMAMDAGILGNHEFNYGLDYLRAGESGRNYPILGANILGGKDQHIVDAPYQIIDQQGVKIAILGLTTAYVPVWERADHLTGLTFESALTTAKRWVPKLRELADVVVVAYHGGFEGDLAADELAEPLTIENEGLRILNQVPGIDALVTGHQHQQLASVVHGVPVTQPGDRGRFVGCIDLELAEDKTVVTATASLLSTATAAPAVNLISLTGHLQARVQEWLDQPLGRVNGVEMTVENPFLARLSGHPYLDFINRVQMAATGTDIAATALFNDEVRGYQSTVTIRQVLNSYVYPNTLVVEEISGTELRAALERCASYFERRDGQVTVGDAFIHPKVQHYNYDFYSGIDYTFDLRLPVGSRVDQLDYHGQPVEEDQLLQVAMNQYRGNGGGEYPMFGVDKVVREVNLDMSELITDYFTTHDPVIAKQPTNFHVITGK